MSRVYVIDTNVILHASDALTSFPDGEVVIPLEVIEELDKFKKLADEKGRLARRVSHFLDDLREKGRLSDGVPLENGGRLRVYTAKTYPEQIGLDPSKMDNHIIFVAWKFQDDGHEVQFISKDINARIKCDVVGVPAHDFEKNKVNFDEFFSGWRNIDVDLLELAHPAEAAEKRLQGEPAYPNEYFVVRDRLNDTRYVVLRRDPESLQLVEMTTGKEDIYGIRPRNTQQFMAFDLLLDPRVSLVTLVGKAGTGKTLLAIAAGLKQVVLAGMYERLIVARPLVPVGKDLGYLPGSKENKLTAWMDPIFDNLEYILNLKPNRKHGYTIERLMDEEILQFEALTYIRGRSIPNQLLIVDEAQNLTPLEVKTIISRAGEGTKVVLTGDPYQIDNPYLDISSNGLVYTADRMRDRALHGHITLITSERSTLAALAAEVL